MLRLVAIAALTIPLFFLLLTLLSRVGLSDDHAAVAAMVTAFVLAPMAFLKLRRPATPDRPNGLPPESLYVVTLTSDEIRVSHPRRPTEAIMLSELSEVSIVTNDSGPWGTDVWWLLLGAKPKSGCSFPGGASGEETVLKFVQSLPGFSNEAFVEAMGSTSNARFVCWRAGA